MEWLEFCSNQNHQLHAAEQVGNYPRTAHTHQAITYRWITDCDVLCTGDREGKPPKFGKPACWYKTSLNTYVLARNKRVTKIKCHWRVVGRSKIVPCIPCYVTEH